MTTENQWLEVLTADQRELRKQKRFSEISLTDEQKEKLGKAGCCWILAPDFYAESIFCQ